MLSHTHALTQGIPASAASAIITSSLFYRSVTDLYLTRTHAQQSFRRGEGGVHDDVTHPGAQSLQLSLLEQTRQTKTTHATLQFSGNEILCHCCAFFSVFSLRIYSNGRDKCSTDWTGMFRVLKIIKKYGSHRGGGEGE